MGAKLISPSLGEHGLRMSPNRKLRKITGPKSKEGAGGLRDVNNEQFCNLYSSLRITVMINSGRKNEMGGPQNANTKITF
jgi:hypothetical protein